MNSKKIEKFFSRSDIPYLIGAALLIISFFFIWLGWSYNYYMFIAGLACFAVGIALFLIGSIGRVGFEDVDKEVNDRLLDFGRDMAEDPHIIKRTVKHLAPTDIRQYDYEGEALESRRGRDNLWRTSQHSALRIIYMNDALIFTRRVFSLLTDYNEITPPKEYKYAELGGAEIVRDHVRLMSGKSRYEVKRARLRLTAADGSEILLTQVPDDLDADNLADQINKLIEHGVVS